MEAAMPNGMIANPFTTTNQTTLQQVLEMIEADNSLHLQRRRNICSALRTLARIMGKSLAYLPAYPGYYRPFFKGLHPEHCGLTLGRIRNIKSDTLFALRHAGCINKGHTYMAPFTDEWQALWDTAECAGRMRVYGSRFFRYCSANGISPEFVNDEVSEQFREALVEESFVKYPIRTHRNVICTWNKIVDLVPGWSPIKLTVPRYKETYTIPLEAFPKPFRDEVDTMFDRWASKDILDDNGPTKPMKPKTIASRRYRLRQIVSGLVRQGWKIEDITSLSQIVQVKAAKLVLRFFLDRAGGNTTSQVHSLAILIMTIAKHWVCVDEDHLAALKDLCSKVNPNAIGMTDKNRDRLRQFDDPKNVRLLLDFPARQVESVRAADRGLRGEAVTIQIALAVELLLMAPVRAENLVAIEIDRHIQRSRTGDDGAVHLVIPGEEVKNGEALEFHLPPETVRLLDLYLRDYHPRLITGPCLWLFPGKDNGCKKRELFGDQVSKHVFKATGLKVNLHLFRHIGAKLYLDQNPGGYEVCRRVLGHRDMNTTVKFYAGTETAAAGRHYDDEILKLRHSLTANTKKGA
jgi:integrase